MVATNFPDGSTNAVLGGTLASYLAQNPARAHQYFNDFDTYLASDWIVTETQAGATQALINEDGGVLALVNSAGAADVNALQLSKETFKLDVKKRAWFEARFKLSVLTLAGLMVGLAITDATPLDPSDGVYFRKPTGSNVLSLVVVKNGVETLTTVATLVADTYVTVGFNYEPSAQRFNIFLGDQRIGSCPITNFPDDEELTVSFGEVNAEAVAKTFSIDWILAAKER